MLIRQFEYLVALARERHFARAALACHVSQPALSAGIRKLESELGVPIVRRGHRFEGFTPEGERVLGWATRILAERDNLTAEVDTVREGRIGTLRVGVLPEAATAFAHVAAPFGARNPRVALSVRSMPAGDIRRGIADGALDCGTVRTPLDPSRTRGRAVLYRERSLLLTADSGRFADRTAVQWDELAHVPLCRLLPDPLWPRVSDAVAAATGEDPAVRVEVDSVPALCEHLGRGGGCAVVTHAWLSPDGLPEGLRAVPMAESADPSGVALAIADRRPEPLLAAELAAFARTVPLQQRLDAVLPAEADSAGLVPEPRLSSRG
ncbi:LysR family transcriptional regulator [Streptomonospora litoralis]|uniref:LysR family transcriptional regulator n=1 Tax=Streptomonospora litoralis TaxID=2498135 RepID=UPI0013F15D69|nr:LysR family transcriptional regulator [Streptomonospora litoralis]